MAGRMIRKWALRAGVSAAVLAVIFRFLPWDGVRQGFASLTPGIFFGVLAAFLACHVATATKWWLLMDRAIPFLSALRAHFGGLAANLCLPGAAGGDAVRAGLAHAALRDGPKVAAAAVGDRLIDLVGLAALSLLGLVFLADHSHAALAWGLAAAVTGGAAVALFVFPPVGRALATRHPGLPARGLVLRLADSFGALARRPVLLIAALLMSMAIQSVLIWLSIRLPSRWGSRSPPLPGSSAGRSRRSSRPRRSRSGGLGVRGRHACGAAFAPRGQSLADRRFGSCMAGHSLPGRCAGRAGALRLGRAPLRHSQGNREMTGTPRVTILGAGPAGIAAAHALRKSGQAEAEVYERAERVGGNSTSFQIDGIWCDYGSHRFHPVAEPSVIADVKDLLGEDLLLQPRHGRIGWVGAGSISR